MGELWKAILPLADTDSTHSQRYGHMQRFVSIEHILITYNRTYRRSQVKLYMRVGDMHPPRYTTSFPLCSYIPHTSAYRRETVHMSASWSATSMSSSSQTYPDGIDPECDKSFTRSDAMAKHMRLQHNISPPLPGRGGNRKRKRDDGAGESIPWAKVSEYSAFLLDAQTPTEGQTNAWDEGRISPPLEEHGDYFSQRRSASPGASSNASIEEDGIADLPEYLQARWNPATNKILDRSPAMVRYLLVKSKHRFVLEQHENLLEELRVVREHEKVAREEKERALDRVLRTELGYVQFPSKERFAV